MTTWDGVTVPLPDHLTALEAERDRRYEDRYITQEKALQIAVDAADRAVIDLQRQLSRVDSQLASIDRQLTALQAGLQGTLTGETEVRAATVQSTNLRTNIAIALVALVAIFSGLYGSLHHTTQPITVIVPTSPPTTR